MVLLSKTYVLFEVSYQGSEFMALTGNDTADKKLCKGLFITLGVSMLTPEYIAPFFIFGLFIYFKRLFSKTHRRALMGEVGKIFFVYMCYMMVSAIWSDTHLLSVLIPLLWMGCFLCYIATANIINTKAKLDKAIYSVVISAGIIGAMAVISGLSFNICKHFNNYTLLFPNPFYYELNDLLYDLMSENLVGITNYRFRSRASATFDNPLILATYLSAVTPFCAFASVHFSNKKHKKISIICFAMALGGIIFTSSRGAYIAAAISIFIFLLSNKRVFKKLLPFVAGLVVAVPLGLFLRYRNTPIGDFFQSDSQRMNIWKYSFKMFLEHPIFGLGAGTENVHVILRDTYGIDRHHAHNLFLQMLAEGGIIGGIFVITIIVLIVKGIIAIFRENDKKYRDYGVLYTSSLIGFTVMSIFEFTLQSPKELMTMFFILGFIEATKRLVRDEVQFPEGEIQQEDAEEKKAVTTV